MEENNNISVNKKEEIEKKIPTLEELENIKAKLKSRDINKETSLQDCIDVVDGFLDGTVTVEQLELFGTKLVVRAYVPILEKMSCLMKVLMKHEISAVENTEIKITELYKDIFFTVVLGLYGQIQFDEIKDKKLLTYETYDKLFPIFNQYILTYCQSDYDMFISMLRDCISLNSAENMVDAMEKLDEEKLQLAVDSNKELIDSLKENEKLVEDMKDILTLNDKNITNMTNQIKKMTVREVMENSKKNLEDQKAQEENNKNKILEVKFEQKGN